MTPSTPGTGSSHSHQRAAPPVHRSNRFLLLMLLALGFLSAVFASSYVGLLASAASVPGAPGANLAPVLVAREDWLSVAPGSGNRRDDDDDDDDDTQLQQQRFRQPGSAAPLQPRVPPADGAAVDFTSPDTVGLEWKLAPDVAPRRVDDELLSAHGLPKLLLMYVATSARVPLFEAPVSSIALGDAAAQQSGFRRFVQRGELLLGATVQQGSGGLWLQTAPREFAPVLSRAVQGKGGTAVVYLKLDMKLGAARVLNGRAFDATYRPCGDTGTSTCKRTANVVAETRRIVRDFDLLRVQRVAPGQAPTAAPQSDSDSGGDGDGGGSDGDADGGAEDAGWPPPWDPAAELLPDGDFDSRMRLLLLPKSASEACASVGSWNLCTMRPACSWHYNADAGRSLCRLDAEVPYPTHLSDAELEYDPGLDFADDARDGERYFVYQPSGGLNNQRIQMEAALVICLLLDRTCVLPPAAQHTNFYSRYNMHPAQRMTPMQRIFDVRRLNDTVKVRTVPRRMSLREWVAAAGGAPFTAAPTGLTADPALTHGWRVVMRDVRRAGPGYTWRDADIRKWFRNDTARFLYFANASMWGTLDLALHSPQANAVKRALTFTDRLKRLAIRFANRFGNYTAMHLRRGDKRVEASFQDVARDPGFFGSRLAKYHAVTRTLYVASDERNMTYFEPLVALGFDVVTHKDFPARALQPFLASFPPTMYMDILGVLEQLVCSYAYRFLGSPFSTFTLYILRMRRAFPALSQLEAPRADERALPSIYDGVPLVNLTAPFYKCNPYEPARHNKPC